MISGGHKLSSRVCIDKLRYYRRLVEFRYRLLLCYFHFRPRGVLPSALCVGVPKAATTWLYQRLRSHPEVSLPQGKELHFFDETYAVRTSTPVFDHIKKKRYWRFTFDLSNSRHWQWYAANFRAGTQRICLDITPTYCRVSMSRIALIKARLPGVKIILFIRNPIDRAWSGAGYFLDKDYGRTLTEISSEELKDWLFDAERLDYGNYLDMIPAWDAHFTENTTIKYVFYDDIVSRPRDVLIDLCRFLDIDPALLPSALDDSQRINSSYRKFSIPEVVKSQLMEIYRPQIDYLERRFARDLSAWRG